MSLMFRFYFLEFHFKILTQYSTLEAKLYKNYTKKLFLFFESNKVE